MKKKKLKRLLCEALAENAEIATLMGEATAMMAAMRAKADELIQINNDLRQQFTNECALRGKAEHALRESTADRQRAVWALQRVEQELSRVTADRNNWRQQCEATPAINATRRLEAVAPLIVWAREVSAGGMMGGSAFVALREILEKIDATP